jgi:hypothetical protein
MWVGLAAFVTGIVLVILGAANVTFKIKVSGNELESNNAGLIIMVAGIVLIFLPMILRPGWTPWRVLRGGG